MKDLSKVTQLVSGRAGTGPGWLRPSLTFHLPSLLGRTHREAQMILELYFVLIFYGRTLPLTTLG